MYTLLEKADAERKREKKDTGKKTRKNRSGEKYNLKKKKKKEQTQGYREAATGGQISIQEENPRHDK